MECNICFESKNDYVECNQCKQTICLNCFESITICPYCRKKYYTRKRPTMKEIIQKCEQVVEMIERLDQILKRIESQDQ